MIQLSCTENGFCLSKDLQTEIMLDDVHIVSNSNWKFPWRIVGHGGANIAVTQEELCKFIGEYLRYVLKDNVEYENKTVGFEFLVKNRT